MSTNNTYIDKFEKMSFENRDRLNNSLFQTKRTKLHENRKDINEKINKDLRMKSGAKNLIELTKDKKIKTKINIEIDYFESNIKLWKEELERVNCALDTYQNMKTTLPMIPLAMKNTIDIDFKNAFRNILSVHYGDDPERYNTSIDFINEKRKRITCPRRTIEGTEDHISYYKIVSNIERRFFFQDRSNGIIFSWNDIFTGVPFQQRTAIFEKSGVLFNLAALFSQLAAATDKTSKAGLEEGQVYFLKAEVCFSHLNTNFVNAPSVDLKPEILLMLSALMRAQAMECKFLFLKTIKLNKESYSNLRVLELVGESLAVSNLFDNVYGCLHIKLLQYLEHLPQTWINLVQIKSNYYKALSYQLLAERYMDLAKSMDPNKSDLIEDLSKELKDIIKPSKYQIQLPSKANEAIGLAKLLINESLQMMEEAVKLASINTYLRDLDDLTSFLQLEHNTWVGKLHLLNEAESYDLLSCPELYVRTRNDLNGQVTFQQIISQINDIDPFKLLGPIDTFNSRVKIPPARVVIIVRDQKLGFGFTVKGQAPMKVVDVEKNSNAEKGGLKIDDVVLAVENHDLKWASQETLIQLSTHCSTIRLRVASITESPLTRNNTTAVHPLEGLSSSTLQSDNLSLSLPNRKSGKLTWKQRISGSWKRRKSKSSQQQVISTLF